MIDVHPTAKQDAAALSALMAFLDEQGNISPYAPGERPGSEEDILRLIEETRNTGNLFIVAEEDEELIGYLLAMRGMLCSMQYMAEIEMGLLPACCDMERGAVLLDFADVWANQCGLKRLECTVQTGNYMLTHLYQNMGYKIEGVRKNSLFIAGRGVSEYYIAKVLQDEADRMATLAALLDDPIAP